MKRTALALAAAAAVVLPGTASYAADSYVVGVAAAMTGPAAGTQAPVIDMLRIYVDGINAKGGVDGHPIKLIVEDDRAEPSRAAAAATKLVRDEGAMLVIDSSLSSTYGPVVAATRRAKVPLWFAGAVCPKETHPPADPLEFCSTAFDFSYDIPVAIDSIKEAAKKAVTLGLIGMPIPISRIGIGNAQKQGEKLGMKTLDAEFIPPTAADYTPFATKLVGSNPDWAFAYAPWVTEVKTFEAMRQLGWKGTYLTYGHIQSENELARLKDGGFHVFSANAFFQDNLPIQEEIRKAAKAGNYAYPATYGAEGWLTGMVLSQVLHKTGWPVTSDKLLAALDSVNVDTEGLRGGPLVWTKENHFRTKQYYRFYRWNPDENKVERIRDWVAVDVTN